MFFCPVCSYSLDLSKTVPKAQVGGEVLSETTDSEDSIMVGGVMDFDKLIKLILQKKKINPTDISGIDMEVLQKSKQFKKLNVDEKNLIFNTVQDNLPKSEKKLFKNKDDSNFTESAFFICKNCGFNKPIEGGTQIFKKSIGDSKLSTTIQMPESYSDRIYDTTLPRTVRYICKNSKCTSHKDPSKREAVFFRLENSYKLRYICTACETTWLN
ncbi:MAG: hypothetical protein CMF62_01615 [Magnetococcales bacterium]|nr:hypothetical protein [Magnetococcales bacterium]|tara:strand:- start:53344 stop:53982 length:639 start_codon:yes stop_codon:yes gene_type:complete